MDKLNYCLNCKRIFKPADECSFCKSKDVKELVRKAPVNIIGTKLKGRVLNIRNEIVDILFLGAKRVKSIREFNANNLKKLL